jgi:hypothetical protein
MSHRVDRVTVMAVYGGRATVINDTGEETDVRASLTSDQIAAGDPVPDWYGTLSGWSPSFKFGEACTLRIGDREGDFVVTAVSPGGPQSQVIIQGSGPPPFD